jgi:long-chain acyl-CoA synthetase
MNLVSLLVRSARVLPERTAVFVGTVPVLTYRALARETAALASSLREKFSLAPGERVALVMSNCSAYAECLFTCWYAGLVCVPANAKLHACEITFILKNSGARVVFVTSDLAATAPESLGVISQPHPIGHCHVADLKSRIASALHLVNRQQPPSAKYLWPQRENIGASMLT